MLENCIEQVSQQTEAEELFADLIESAYLSGLIDGEAQTLAYLWLANNHQDSH